MRRARLLLIFFLLCITLNPLDSSAAKSGPVIPIVKIPPFSFVAHDSPQNQLVTFLLPPNPLPVGVPVPLSLQSVVSEIDLSVAKFRTSGKYCSIVKKQVIAIRPAICTVNAVIPGKFNGKLVKIEPVDYSFGLAQAMLTVFASSDTLQANPKGVEILLGASGGSGLGSVHFFTSPGNICSVETVTVGNLPKSPCTGINTRTGSICSVVGMKLMANASAICSISATKDGDDLYYPTYSNSLTINFGSGLGIQPRNNPTGATPQVSLTIRLSAPSVQPGDNVTVTATGGSGTGLFNFVIYQSSSNCSLVSQDRTAGTAVISSPVSTICSVQATRSGSGIYTYALSNTLPITWGTIAQQIPLVISNDPTSANAGETITVTTVGGQGDGAITFRELSYSPSCILTADGHLFRASYGTCSVQATKAGDSIYSSQKSQIIRFTFYGSQAQSALTISNTLLTASVGSPITLTTLGGSSSGRVSYVITGGTGAGSIQGSTLVGSRAGTITVVATKDGDQQYGSVVSAPITFTITG